MSWDKDHGDIINRDLVLFALYECGGAEHSVHTEDVADQVFKYPLGKQRYRWERYMYPDKERVARELRRLKDMKGTKYVKGHVNIGKKKDRMDGWMLTEAGVDRIKKIGVHMSEALQKSTGEHHRYTEDNLRQRISSTTCYRNYLSDPEMKEAQGFHFTDMLYCLPDAPQEKIISAFDKLIANAKAVGADDLIEFLETARIRFNEFFF